MHDMVQLGSLHPAMLCGMWIKNTEEAQVILIRITLKKRKTEATPSSGQ